MDKHMLAKASALVLAILLLIATALPAAAAGKRNTKCVVTKLPGGYTQITCPDGGWD